MKATFRHQYDEQRDAEESAKTTLTDFGPSLTEMHHAEDADINVLVKRFGITDGAIPPAALDPKYYGDFTDAVDFRTALDRTRDAEQRFRELPADLRKRFNNDPAELYAFVSDERNTDLAVELGLLARSAVQPVAEEKTPTPPKNDTTK